MNRYRMLWRDLGIALSLANLLFLKGWLELLEGVRHPYFRKDIAFYWYDTAALMLDVLLLGVVFWAAVTFARKSGQRGLLRNTRGIFVVAVVFWFFMAANVLRRQYPVFSLDALAQRFGKTLLLVFLLGVLSLVVFLFQRYRISFVQVAATLLLVTVPFVAVTFGKAVWLGLSYHSLGGQEEVVAARKNVPRTRPATRVLWFIFDNMDYRITFPDRPSGLSLPELDRLCQESVCATNAYAPSPVTGRSMPALFTGKQVTRAVPSSPDELMITFEGADGAVPWSRQPNVFQQAKQAGYRTGLVGWYHPYCRIFPGTFSACTWMPFRQGDPLHPVIKSMNEFLMMAMPPWARFDLVGRLGILEPAWDTKFHTQTYSAIHEDALRLVADPELDLVMVHWPVPHIPYIYDRQVLDFTLTPHPREGYLDNLALVDRTLREVRSKLEAAGLWEQTTLLVSTDHAWNGAVAFDGKRDARIPFILKLAGSARGAAYHDTFNSIITPDLLLALMKGELRDAESVTGWLDRRVAAASN